MQIWRLINYDKNSLMTSYSGIVEEYVRPTKTLTSSQKEFMISELAAQYRANGGSNKDIKSIISGMVEENLSRGSTYQERGNLVQSLNRLKWV